MKGFASSQKAFWLVLVPLCAFLFFFRLGDRSFRNPDEGRYAKIAQEMTASVDKVTPTLYGIDYLRKPPLLHWLTSASFKCFGFSEWSARAVPAAFSILTMILLYFFTVKLYDPRTALFSALILISNVWFLNVSRVLLIDAVFSFFVVASIFCFYLSHFASNKKFFYSTLFFLSVSMAFMAKGMLAIVLPGVAIALYALLSRNVKRVVREGRWLWGCFIFLLVVGPWLYWISAKHAEFWDVFFVREHFQRLAARDFEHQEPWYYYGLMLIVFFMPWSFFVRPLGFIRDEVVSPRKSSPLFYLAVSSLAMVLFLSISRSKLPTYILPTIPLLSILFGRAWALWPNQGSADKESGKDLHTLVMIIIFLLLAIAALVGVPLVVSRFADKVDPTTINHLQWMAACLVSGSVLALRLFRRGIRGGLLYVFVAMMAAALTLLPYIAEDINVDYTTKPLAMKLKKQLKPDDEVYIFDHPGPFYDFGFYLDHPVKLVGLEGEFEISRDDKSAQQASITRDLFMAKLKAAQPLYCVIRRSDFESFPVDLRKHLKIVYQNRRKILFESGELAL